MDQPAIVPDPNAEPWYRRPDVLFTFKAVLGGFFVFSFIVGVFIRDNDFQWHYSVGEGLYAGAIYAHKSYHYPFGRVLMNALLASMPYRIARAVLFAISSAGLVLSFRIWEQMAGKRTAVEPGIPFAAAFITVMGLVSYVQRDFDECGMQFFLVLLLSLAGWFLTRPGWFSKMACGAYLGTAIVYKATPLIFVPFLLYKRQWQAACWALLFFGVFNFLVPIVGMGWPTAREADRMWLDCMSDTFRQKDPSRTPIIEPKQQNQSLKAALSRYLMTFPPGDPLFVARAQDIRPDETTSTDAKPHPLFFQFGNLSPPIANRVVTLVLGTLALALAWRFRKPWGDAPGSGDIAPEWAGVMILCAVLSPFCWLQHMVLMLPAAYLVIRAAIGRKPPRWRVAAIGFIAINSLVLQRELMGKNLSILWLSYHPHTAVGLVMLFLVLTLPESGLKRPDAAAASVTEPLVPNPGA